jgi:hypothetical protein
MHVHPNTLARQERGEVGIGRYLAKHIDAVFPPTTTATRTKLVQLNEHGSTTRTIVERPTDGSARLH